MRVAVVLAGGKGKRFGSNKALFNYNGRTMVSWVIDALFNVCDRVYLSVDNIHKYSHIKCSGIMEDERSGIGPICGIITAFRHLKNPYIAVAPCDAPHIVPEIYNLMFDLIKGYDAVVPKIGGKYEPLVAVYNRKKILKYMTYTMSKGQFAPISAYKYLNILYLNKRLITSLDPLMNTFRNINTKRDILNKFGVRDE